MTAIPDQQRSRRDLAFPPPLQDAEEAILCRKPGRYPGGPRVGVGLSGGGIRSATFCLGAMQWIAGRGLLGRIDYLSTVSGGGYFGAFLGRLFTRRREGADTDASSPMLTSEDVAAHLDPHAATDPPVAPRGTVLRWLRENGRYLAPKGAGDLLLGGAVLVRNLLSLHLVLSVALLSLWLLLQGFREIAAGGLAAGFGAPGWVTGLEGPAQDAFLWWSPFSWLAAAVVLLYVVPAAAGYWVLMYAGHETADKAALRKSRRRLWGLVIVALLLAAVGVERIATAEPGSFRAHAGHIFLVVGLALVLALGFAFLALRRGRKRSRSAEQENEDENALDLYADSRARHWISDQLSTGMQVALVVIVIAAIDTLGQSLYLYQARGYSILQWLSGAAGTAVAFGIAARRVLVTFGGQPHGSRLSWLPALAAQTAAIVLVLLLLLLVNVLSHAIVWGFALPPSNGAPHAWRLTGTTLPDAALLFALALAFTLFFGRQRNFVNSSTHQPLYSARLTRAYLGASNPRRHTGRAKNVAVTTVVREDDLAQEDYWPWAEPSSERWVHAPLHFVNVTINETCDGRSHIQQQDRKGTGMAIGPCGFSVGVRHHLVGPGHQVFPEQDFRVFHSESAQAADEFAPEPLSLGKWVGISGAAFSTGLGARTNLGLSLLLGLANVRLGYWWDSGITRKGAESRLRRLLPVYAELLDEFTARFHGTAQRRWYLSDGGHFENLGGYELIRRRLQTIILVDAEADPDYHLQGLAGLIRKARIDFGAEVRFLDEEELDGLLDDDTRRYVGSLAELRRGRWTNEPFDEPSLKTRRRPRQVLDPPDRRRFSRAHAALARICYDGSPRPGSWLLYIKATLTGDEPADLLEYHANHPDFPHQTTADQFFDEAQWESYRRLGEHILEKLLPEHSRLEDLLGLVPRSP
jgi:hypothetical protein